MMVRSAATPRGLLTPCGEIEIYLLQGWQLLDELTCGLVQMTPPACVNRVPNDNEKMTGRSGRCEPVKSIDHDAGSKLKAHRPQER
jgi:hypothetical protein